jgi:hypothetical protein
MFESRELSWKSGRSNREREPNREPNREPEPRTEPRT